MVLLKVLFLNKGLVILSLFALLNKLLSLDILFKRFITLFLSNLNSLLPHSLKIFSSPLVLFKPLLFLLSHSFLSSWLSTRYHSGLFEIRIEVNLALRFYKKSHMMLNELILEDIKNGRPVLVPLNKHPLDQIIQVRAVPVGNRLILVLYDFVNQPK